MGINNRDLRTFHAELEHTLHLRGQIPPDRLVVGESGIRTRADALRLEAAGVAAMLVGETLVTRPTSAPPWMNCWEPGTRGRGPGARGIAGRREAVLAYPFFSASPW